MVEAAILTCRWVSLRKTNLSQRQWLSRRCTYIVDLRRGQEIQGLHGVGSLFPGRYFGSGGRMAYPSVNIPARPERRGRFTGLLMFTGTIQYE